MALGDTALLVTGNKLGFSCTGQILHCPGKADQDKMIQRYWRVSTETPCGWSNILQKPLVSADLCPDYLIESNSHSLVALAAVSLPVNPKHLQTICTPCTFLRKLLVSINPRCTTEFLCTLSHIIVSSMRLAASTILAFFFHSFTAIPRTAQIFSSTMYFCMLILQRVFWSRPPIHLPTYLLFTL